MNLVDVILHTRAPVGRLIDWIDQAFLLIHLDPVSRAEIDGAGDVAPASGGATRLALRRIGVRSATDLLRAFGAGDPHRPVSAAHLRARGLDPAQLATLLRLLVDEPGLNPVWNWKAGGTGRTRNAGAAMEPTAPASASASASVERTPTRHRTASGAPRTDALH
jgi:hypothetical protein